MRTSLVGRAEAPALHVMSLNVRCDVGCVDAGDPDHWPSRASLIETLLRTEEPTLLGVQEADHHQLATLEAGLARHRLVGFGREGGSRGEHSAILYDSDRLDLLAWDQVWLSDTPRTIGSTSWGHPTPRVLTWAHLRDRATGRELLHLNTHLDHESERARVRGAEVVRDLVAQAGLPVLVTGDFNATATRSAAYDVLTQAGLVDTWASAALRLTEETGTFTGYGPVVPGGDRIDWVLATPGVVVDRVAINPFILHDRRPSDHLPVQALLRL